VSRNPNQTNYAPGTIVSVTAAPANGYEFARWSGSSTSANAALTGPIDRDLTLTANFQRKAEPEPEPATPKPYTVIAKEPGEKLPPRMLTARISGGALFVGGAAFGGGRAVCL
jgi:hypothetical protein